MAAADTEEQVSLSRNTSPDNSNLNITEFELGPAILYPNGERVSVALNSSQIIIKANPTENIKNGRTKSESDLSNKDVIINWTDFVGCHSQDIIAIENSNNKKMNKIINIISYVVWSQDKKTNYNLRKRSIVSILPYSALDSENDKTSKWVDKLNLIGRKYTYLKYHPEATCVDSQILREKRILVCVNPVSGPGKGENIFHEHVEPVLNDAHVEFELFVTNRQNQLRERLSQEDLTKWDAIIYVSGDGLIAEGINGIMERQDSREAMKMPFGVIPGGSGNALIATILRACNEAFTPLNAAFITVKGLHGAVRDKDLAVAKLGDGKDRYFFLGSCFGLIADLDIETEPLRWMGEPRFTLGAIWRILLRRDYRSIISYLPAESDNNSDWVTLESTNYTCFHPVLLPLISAYAMVAPEHTIGCGFFSLALISGEVGKIGLLNMLSKMDNGMLVADENFKLIKAKAYRLVPINPFPGTITIDGEAVNYGEMSAKILHEKLQIFSPN